MAHQVFRPLKQWLRIQHQCCLRPSLLHPHFFAIKTTSLQLSTLPFSHRNSDFRSQGLKLSKTPVPSDLQDDISDSEYQTKKSRNEKKREARRAFQWGMELANFSTPQIKTILRVASLEREVFDALMLVKRLGPDVREGKRRQFNYIGRLLRNAQPELMDALIQASKDGDQSQLQALSGAGSLISGEKEEEEEGEGEDTEYEEEEEEEYQNYFAVAARWSEGLTDKDSDITNEVYSIHGVEFDRQELRKLVRRVHSIEERKLTDENKGEVDAKKSLIRFLRAIAKQMPTE